MTRAGQPCLPGSSGSEEAQSVDQLSRGPEIGEPDHEQPLLLFSPPMYGVQTLIWLIAIHPLTDCPAGRSIDAQHLSYGASVSGFSPASVWMSASFLSHSLPFIDTSGQRTISPERDCCASLLNTNGEIERGARDPMKLNGAGAQLQRLPLSNGALSGRVLDPQ